MKPKFKLPVWVLTIAMCVVTIAGTLAAFWGIYFYDIGILSGQSGGYLRLDSAQAAARQAATEIAYEYDRAVQDGAANPAKAGNIQNLLNRYSPENSNILFVLYTPGYDEEVLLSNFTNWDPDDLIDYWDLVYGDTAPQHDMASHYTEYVSFGTEGIVNVAIAIRRPMTAVDTFTIAKAIYDDMAAFAFAPYIIIAISIVLYIPLCIVWSRRVYDAETKVNLATRVLRMLPADFMLLLLFAAAFLALYGTALSLVGMMRSFTVVGVIIAALVCLSFMLLCLGYLYMLLLQRKERRLLRCTLIGRVAWMLRRADTRLPTVVLFCLLTLGFAGSGLVVFYMMASYYWHSGFFILCSLLFMFISGVCLVAAIYSTWCANGLAKTAKQVAGGEYNLSLEKSHLYGPYRAIAENLEQVGGGLRVAVAEQMKSERMKTELITNVSHDIKTPLTSIVNYVDLLGRLALDNEQADEYLEVLQRQSLRLKKLAEDVVEASRAASGDMTMELAPVDISELLRQAVAEYENRYNEKRLDCVVSAENETVLADGGLLWRVLDNLLGNAEKYAMPGSRIYIDVCGDENDNALVRMTLRNISDRPLNISAEELMERFVRGDEARSESGSGLGLSISRSLVEIQGGRFELSVDGDLFKVNIWLPKAGPGE